MLSFTIIVALFLLILHFVLALDEDRETLELTKHSYYKSFRYERGAYRT